MMKDMWALSLWIIAYAGMYYVDDSINKINLNQRKIKTHALRK